MSIFDLAAAAVPGSSMPSCTPCVSVSVASPDAAPLADRAAGFSEISGWAGRAEDARLLYWDLPQRPPNAGAGRHPAVPRRGTLLRRRRKFFELVAGEANLVVRWADMGRKWNLMATWGQRDLVERSILVYGKWGQNGRLRGAMGCMSFA